VSDTADQLRLEIPEPPIREISYVFGGVQEYREAAVEQATTTGMERSRLADRNGLDEAIRIIESFPPGAIITADEIRSMQRVGSPRVLGSAFRRAAALDLIRIEGVTTAQAVSAHGRLARSWRRTER
jgi:hypothetical protein